MLCLGPGILPDVIKVVCWRELLVVPLSLLFVTDMFLVCRVSDCLRGVLPPGVLGLRRMFAMVSEACLVLPVVGMASIVMVDVEDVSLVYPPVRLRRGDLLVLPLCRRVREATSGHFLHQSLGGRDGDPVTVVYWNVEKPATTGLIAVLQCPSLKLDKIVRFVGTGDRQLIVEVNRCSLVVPSGAQTIGFVSRNVSRSPGIFNMKSRPS